MGRENTPHRGNCRCKGPGADGSLEIEATAEAGVARAPECGSGSGEVTMGHTRLGFVGHVKTMEGVGLCHKSNEKSLNDFKHARWGRKMKVERGL